MDPVTLRRIEYLSGVGAAVLGVVVPGYAIVFTSDMTQYMLGGSIGALALFGMIVIPALLVGGAAWFDTHFDRLGQEIGLGVVFLLITTMMLWGIAFAIQLAFDPYVLPTAILALVSTLCGVWALLRTAEAH